MRKNAILIPLLFLGMALSVSATEKSVEELLADLTSNSVASQLQAAKMLGAKREERALPGLVRILKDSTSSAELLRVSSVALGLIAKPGEGTEALLQLAHSGASPSVRYSALLGLASTADLSRKEEILSFCARIEKGTSDPLLRDLAVRVRSGYSKSR